MPANLTHQYFAAEERYRLARTDAEKLTALQEMLSEIPKHKGTDKMQADLKRRIAQLRTASGMKSGAKRMSAHAVERSGAAQVALVGTPNSGKSRLVRDHTHAAPEVAPYPGTTWTPTPGMVLVADIPLQLIDLPVVHHEHVEPWLLDLARNADLLLVWLDLSSDDILEEWEALLLGLGQCRITLGEAPPIGEREIGRRYHKAVYAGNKCDLPGARDRLEILQMLTGELPVLTCSLETGEGVDEVLGAVVETLHLIRIYTKLPHEEPDLEKPFVLHAGARVEDVARLIHKDLAEHMKSARAWGDRFHSGQPVGREQIVEDGDILEFHE